jgi:hypothetical protein
MGDFNDLGGVSILGFISPFNTGDTYPVIDPLYGIDGLRNLNNLSDLNSIPNARRRSGMIVGVSGGTNYYKLNSSPWSGNISDWSEIFISESHITGFTYNPNNNRFIVGDTYGESFSADILSVSGLSSSGLISSDSLSANTYLNLPIDVFVTGGTYNNNIGRSVFTNNTGGTFNVDGFFTGSTEVFVTGGTYNNNIGRATFVNTTGGTFNVDGFFTGSTDVFVTGGTYNSGVATFRNNTGGTFNVDGFFTGSTDVFVTGGTYNSGVATFRNNTGGTFNVNGFFTGNTDVFVTGGTYNSGVATFKNNTGGTFNVNGFFTGGTNSFLTTTITQSADTLSFDYNYYGVNYSGQVDLTLPNPSGFDGRNINIKDESGNAGIYRIRLTPSFGLIDGATYVDMNLNYISLNIVARNNNWWII